MDALVQRTTASYREIYGTEPTYLLAAPGRVNLIGEHTDYNDGFVLPAAIDRHVIVAVSARPDRAVRIHAADFCRAAQFNLDQLTPSSEEPWSNYQRGVAWALQEAGYGLKGLDAVVAGDVPIASGLSSSAAIEVATAFAFQVLGDLDLDGVERALLCQKAENEFVGIRCGIMDQYIISLGKRSHALLIDCRSLEYQLVPVPTGYSLVVCDTKKRRGLVDSEYNTRRAQCEEGARLLGLKALRDITPEAFKAHAGALPPVIRKRCRHVVTENQRVLDAVQSLRDANPARFGELMDASHTSLQHDYEVSCAELDAMVAAARRQPGVLGARMTGAGFGGCTINLVAEDATEAFRRNVAAAYAAETGLDPEIYVCAPEEGVRLL
jgi:galactokinase